VFGYVFTYGKCFLI